MKLLTPEQLDDIGHREHIESKVIEQAKLACELAEDWKWMDKNEVEVMKGFHGWYCHSFKDGKIKSHGNSPLEAIQNARAKEHKTWDGS